MLDKFCKMFSRMLKHIEKYLYSIKQENNLIEYKNIEKFLKNLSNYFNVCTTFQKNLLSV